MGWITLLACQVLPCVGHPVTQALFPDQGGASTVSPASPGGFTDRQTAASALGQPAEWQAEYCVPISGSSRAGVPTGPLELGGKKPRGKLSLGHWVPCVLSFRLQFLLLHKKVAIVMRLAPCHMDSLRMSCRQRGITLG